jgi:hypothetical protein
MSKSDVIAIFVERNARGHHPSGTQNKRSWKETFMLQRIHRVGVWSAIAFLVILGLGLLVFAGFVPPPRPAATGEQIAAMYQTHANGIRFGMVLIIIASGFYLPWTVTLSALIRRMEGESTFLSQCELLGGVFASLTFFLPAVLFGAAAFRPERNPELTVLLNDVGWILFIVAPIPPFVVQYLSLGIAILCNRSEPVPLPRWFGFATLWFVMSFLPPFAGFFFKSGPFAWNGLFTFWIPVVGFGVWLTVLLALIFRSFMQSPAAAGRTHSGSVTGL